MIVLRVISQLANRAHCLEPADRSRRPLDCRHITTRSEDHITHDLRASTCGARPGGRAWRSRLLLRRGGPSCDRECGRRVWPMESWLGWRRAAAADLMRAHARLDWRLVEQLVRYIAERRTPTAEARPSRFELCRCSWGARDALRTEEGCRMVTHETNRLLIGLSPLRGAWHTRFWARLDGEFATSTDRVGGGDGGPRASGRRRRRLIAIFRRAIHSRARRRRPGERWRRRSPTWLRLRGRDSTGQMRSGRLGCF